MSVRMRGHVASSYYNEAKEKSFSDPILHIFFKLLYFPLQTTV